MVTIYARSDGAQGHYQFKCEYKVKHIKFFNLDKVPEEYLIESNACYDRAAYTYLCEAESLEDFIQEQKLLNLLEE